MRSIKEILNNLSLIRVSGHKDYILFELNGSIGKLIHLKLTERIYILEKKDILDNLNIVSSKIFCFGNDFGVFAKEFNNFVSNSKITDPLVLVGINEFKFTSISIPRGIEDEEDDAELWFTENSSKFLPEGSNLNTFTFSHEITRVDEDYKTYALIIARKDYLSRISDSLTKVQLSAIFPFITALTSFSATPETSNLIIDFTSNKIIYGYCDVNGNFLTGEVYTDLYDDQFDLEKRSINREELRRSLIEIRNFISSSFPNFNLNKLNYFIVSQSSEYLIIEELSEKILGVDIANQRLTKYDPFFTSSYISLNKFINYYETNLNLIDDQNKQEISNKLEKQAGLRVVLTLGITLISLLFFAYLGNILLSYQSSTNEGIIAKLENNKNQIAILKKNNFLLKKNIILFKELKENRKGYSELLTDISKNINYNSRLTELEIMDNNSKSLKITVKGFSRSQNQIADFLRIIEKNNKFRNIVLKNITSEDYRGKKYDDLFFIVTAEYYESN